MIFNALRKLAVRLALGLAVLGALILAPAALARTNAACHSGAHHRSAGCPTATVSRHHARRHTGSAAKGRRTSHGTQAGLHAATIPAAVAPKCDDGSKFTLVADLLTCGDGSSPVCANGWDPALAAGGLTITCVGATSADNGQATCDDGSTPTVDGDGSIDCDDGSFAACPDGSDPTVAGDGGTLVCDAPGSDAASSDASGGGTDDSAAGMCADGGNPAIAGDGSLQCDDGSAPQCADGSTASLAPDGNSIVCGGASDGSDGPDSSGDDGSGS